MDLRVYWIIRVIKGIRDFRVISAGSAGGAVEELGLDERSFGGPGFPAFAAEKIGEKEYLQHQKDNC